MKKKKKKVMMIDGVGWDVNGSEKEGNELAGGI